MFQPSLRQLRGARKETEGPRAGPEVVVTSVARARGCVCVSVCGDTAAAKTNRCHTRGVINAPHFQEFSPGGTRRCSGRRTAQCGPCQGGSVTGALRGCVPAAAPAARGPAPPDRPLTGAGLVWRRRPCGGLGDIPEAGKLGRLGAPRLDKLQLTLTPMRPGPALLLSVVCTWGRRYEVILHAVRHFRPPQVRATEVAFLPTSSLAGPSVASGTVHT